MKWTHYVFVWVTLCAAAAVTPVAQAQITSDENACTWGIANDELAIPAGSIITRAVLVLQNVRSTRPNAALAVQLLDNPNAGLDELTDAQTGNYFDGFGTPLAAFTAAELSTTPQTISLDLNAVENPDCWTRRIFETAPVVTLADSSSVTCTSALLALFDYAGTGRSFGFGIDCDGVAIDAVKLNLTIQSTTQLTGTELTFSEGKNNSAPLLNPVNDPTLAEGQLFQLTVSGTDPDGDSLTYAADNLPAGAAFSGQTLRWTPGYDQAGTYEISLSVSDGVAAAVQTVTLTVLDTNRAPVLSAIGNHTVAEGNTLSFDLAATDPDNDALTLTCGPLPAGAAFSGSRFTWTPGYTQAGTYTLTAAVSDGSLTDTETVTLTVTNTNRAPVLTPIADQTVTAGQLLTIAIACSDPDGDTVTLTGQNLPGGAVVANGRFTWTPAADQAGTWTVTIVANDGRGASDTQIFQITVEAPVQDWKQLTYDDFESGLGNYTDGGRDCRLDTGGRYAHQGVGSLNIQDDSGADSTATLTNGLDLNGYTELKIEFWYQAVSMDSSDEGFRLEYWNGTQWSIVKDWLLNRNFQNNQYYFETVTLSSGSVAFPADAKIRFVCDASSNYDDIYLDDISISAK